MDIPGMIILVAACPSGLLVSIPMAFLGGIGAAARTRSPDQRQQLVLKL